MKKTLESWLSMLLAFMLLLSYVPALGLQAQAVGDPDDEEPALETTSTNTLYDDFVNGLVPEEYPMSYPKLPLFAPFSILPSSYDARAYNYISSVKNQGSNGLCWAFAAYGIVESNLLKSTQGERDLSELHMGYATSDHSGNTQGYSRTPGGGGNRVYAASYLMRGSDLSGTVAEANDPYITSILQDRDLSITKGKPKNYTVQDVIFLNGESKESILSDTIKEAIMQYGAVAASMYWDGTATADVGPGNTTYYKASTASYYYYNSPAVTNHAVTIIGWNDNYSKSNFNETYPPSNNGAWLVKNSWDTDWGNYGYFWISYEDTTFPLSAYVIDGVTAYDASSTVYEDDYKSAGTYGYSNSDVWYTEVFSALSDSEQLDNVKVYFTTSNITVSIYATSNFDGTSTINKSTPSASRYIEYPGWYTFKFSNPVTLGAIGSAFAVAVRINASEVSNNRIAYSTDPKINSTYTARGSSPTSWTTESYNFCIKAVTSANTNAVSSVASALTWDSIRDNNYGQSFVADNLVTPLPTSGEYGTSISWTSSNPSVLSTTGIVSRVTSNIPVTLTATVSKGSESQQVIFNLTVLAEPANAYEAIQQAKLILTWDAIKGANTLQNSVEKNLVLPTTGINGTTISWHSSNPQISDNGVVTVDTKITGILTGNFTATITKGSTSDTADFPLTVKITDNIKPQASAIAPTGQFLDIGTVTNLVLKFSETVEAIAGKTITIAAYEKIFAYNTDGSAYPIRGTGNFAFTYTIPSSPNIISGFGNECIATIPISAFGNLVTFGTSPSYYNNINASLNKLQDNFRTYCLFVSTDAFLDLSGNSMPHLITYSSVPSYSQYDVFFSKTKVAPAVSSVVPASGSTNTPTSGTISVTFSKQMDKLVPGTISLNSSATSGGSWSSDGTVYTVNYTGLAGNTAYTINISGFSDPDGNIMTANSSYSFTTAASAPVELYNIIYHDNGGYGGPATTEGLLPGKYELSIIHPMHVKSETIDVLFIGWSMMQGSILDAYNVGPSLITQVDIVDANVIVFAVWGYDRNGNGIPDVVEPKYTLTYNLNGGIGGPSPNPVSGLLAYDSYTLSMTKPTHADVGGIKVAFMGWTFAQDTKIYAKSEIAPIIFTSISINGNNTVYAVWGYDENYNGMPDVFEEMYTLTYNLNTGTGGPSPNPVTGLLAYDSYTLSMTKPTHADVDGRRVVFLGWTYAPDTKIYTKDNIAPTLMMEVSINGNTTVYAVWGYDENRNGVPDVFEQKYTLTYNLNGGIDGPSPNPVTGLLAYDSYTLSMTKPTHADVGGVKVAFMGWTFAQDTKIYAKSEIAPLIFTSISIDGNKTVYAVWGYDENYNGIPDVFEELYSLTYNLNGGIDGPSPNPVTGLLAYDSYTLSMSKPTHADVSGVRVLFMGWKETLDTRIYAFNDTAPTIMSTIFINGNKTVYAVWGYDENANGIPDVFEETYDIIYDNNGGTGGPGVRAGLISGIYEISRPNPTHVSLDGDNVLFIGWSLTRSPILYVFDTTPTLAAYVYIANANVVLFAVWGYDRDGNGIADAFEGHITIYNPNGGTGGPGTIPGRLYGQYPLDAPNPTHASSDGSNVLFVGWSLMQISEILESYSAIPAMEGNVFLDGADVTLYAVWGYDRNNNGTADIGERKFSIIYNDNGGTGGPGTLAGRLAGTYAIAMPNPTHAPVGGNNVLFLGWSLTQISTILEATDTVPTLSSNVAISTANVTLYAVWRYDRGGSESIWAKVNGEPIENGGVYKSAVAVNKTNITATPGATIAIQKGGVAYTGANLTASNIYAVTISNAGITQIEFSIIVDTVKPTISVSPADNNGIVANNKWTNSDVAVTLNTSTTLISGTVRYQYGIPDEAGVVDENAWVDINGNVFTIPQPANDEITVNYKFRAISQTGIIGNATTKWTFNIDTIRPAYTVVTQKEAGFSGYGQNVVINFTEPVTLYYTLDGVEGSKKSTANENNSITLSTDGLYTAIRAVDKAGNLTVNNIEDITISKTKPSAVVVSPSDANGVITNSKWTNSDVIVDLSVTSSATVTYQYGVPDETGAVTESAWVNITGSTFKISKPTNGEITVNYKFRAISQTGVAGNASTKWTFNIDTIKPVFTIMTEKETGFNGYGQNVVINFTEPVTLHYKHDSVEDSKKSANNADNSVTLNAEGVYTTISATDKAGNLTTKNISSITINKTKPVITLDPSIPNNQKTNSNVIVKITATPETGLSMRYQVKEGTGGEWVTITTASGKNGATFVIPQKIASNTATYYFQAINNVSGVVSGQKTYKANITGGISVVFGSKVISLTNPQEFKPVYYFTSAISKAQITYSEAISALVIREYTVDSTLGDQVTALANNKKYSATVTIGSEEYHFDLVVDTVTPGAPIIAAVTSDESTYKSNTLTNSDIRINLSPAANYSGISGIYGYKYAEVEVTIDGEGKTVNEFIEDSKGVIWHDIVDSNGIPTDVFEVKAAQGESLLKRYKFKAVSNAELETNVANANSPFVVNIDKTELLWSIEPAAAAAEVVAGFDGYAANVNLYANKTGAQFGYKLDGVEVALKTVNVNTLAVSLTTNGSYTDIYVVDKAGNRKDLADKNGKPIEIVINKTRPTLGALVIDPPTATSGKLSTQDVTVALTVTNGVPAVYQYRIDDGGWLDIDGNVLVIMGPINTGKYTFRAVNAVSGIIGTGDKSYSANIKY